jgi:hypothetical protein
MLTTRVYLFIPLFQVSPESFTDPQILPEAGGVNNSTFSKLSESKSLLFSL